MLELQKQWYHTLHSDYAGHLPQSTWVTSKVGFCHELCDWVPYSVTRPK